MAIGCLSPRERRRDIIHVFVYILEREIAICRSASCSKEVYSCCRSIDGNVFKGDVIKRIRGGGAYINAVRTSIVDADVIRDAINKLKEKIDNLIDTVGESGDETKPKNPAQILKKINGSKEKDLSNEVLYFSINQDSKLVKIIYIFII